MPQNESENEASDQQEKEEVCIRAKAETERDTAARPRRERREARPRGTTQRTGQWREQGRQRERNLARSMELGSRLAMLTSDGADT